MSFDYQKPGSVIIVSSINVVANAIGSLFVKPLVCNHEPQSEFDDNVIQTVVVATNTIPDAVKRVWEDEAAARGIPVVYATDKEQAQQRIEERLITKEEAPKPIEQPKPAETKPALPSGLSGLLEEAKRLEEAREAAENAALEALTKLEHADSERARLAEEMRTANQQHTIELDAIQQQLQEAQAKIDRLTNDRALDKVVKEKDAALQAVERKHRELIKLEEKLEKTQEETKRAREAEKTAKESLAQVKSTAANQSTVQLRVLEKLTQFGSIIARGVPPDGTLPLAEFEDEFAYSVVKFLESDVFSRTKSITELRKFFVSKPEPKTGSLTESVAENPSTNQ